MSTTFEKQMNKECELNAAEIKKAIDAALGSKQTQAALEKLTKSKEWPAKPTKEVLKLYDKTASDTWKKLKSKYQGMDAVITVEAPSKRPPFSKVTASFKSQWRGGKKLMLQPGCSLADMAETVYGSPVYAVDVLKANAKEMNASLRCLPAGFAVTFPRILVPEIHTKPKMSLPKIATTKAVRVALPAMEMKYDFKTTTRVAMMLGNFILYVEVEGKCDIVAKKSKGYLDASFNVKAYEAELKKGFGPVEGGFKVTATGKPKTFLNIKLVNTKLGGITFASDVNLAEGAFSISLGSQPFIKRLNGIDYSGVLSMSAKLRIIPMPPKTLRVRIPKHFPKVDLVDNIQPEDLKVPQFGIKEVVVVGVGVAFVASGAWTILVGGAALKTAGAMTGLALAAVLAQGS